ncbi:hypothetical protein ACFU1R_29610 [Priestia megaterium]|uniref:hypothetical protein n=1 Tax=Priestia megaterium TaxID=1404 RepID=UPI00366B6F66
MNIYILVEGNTEKYVYPEWINGMMPKLSQVSRPEDVVENNYYIFGNMGFPNIFNDLENVVSDTDIISNYDHLILSLDTDDEDISVRKQRAFDICNKHEFPLSKFHVVVHNPCFETWCLGNRVIFSRTPQLEELKECIQHFDVSNNDPELMKKPSDFAGSIGTYHELYLRKVFQERNITYKKGKAAARYVGYDYFNQILKRAKETGHLDSFKEFYELFHSLSSTLNTK